MKRLRWLLWANRWWLVGGIFVIVGIIANDVRSMIVGVWFLIDDRIVRTREYLDLQILEMETRLASGSTRVWVRKEN